MLGNSSSAIIEAASFGLPVNNIGSRQHLRERSKNVLDVSPDSLQIEKAIQNILQCGKKEYTNIYGDGNAGKKICHLLSSLPLDKALLSKSNAY